MSQKQVFVSVTVSVTVSVFVSVTVSVFCNDLLYLSLWRGVQTMEHVLQRCKDTIRREHLNGLKWPPPPPHNPSIQNYVEEWIYLENHKLHPGIPAACVVGMTKNKTITCNIYQSPTFFQFLEKRYIFGHKMISTEVKLDIVCLYLMCENWYLLLFCWRYYWRIVC